VNAISRRDSTVGFGGQTQVNATKSEPSFLVKKSDGLLQVVWGEVYSPDFPDSQGEFMTRDEVRDLAWRFIARKMSDSIDLKHNQIDGSGVVVESFIARDDDQTFIPGSWVLGVHVPDATIWGQIQKGELNGFSMEAWVTQTPKIMTFDFPDEVDGETTVTADHKHAFAVKFDQDGRFLGGRTGPGGADGHTHLIVKGTATETTAGHNHRFSFLEGVLERDA
jgi:hypothetical protein